MKISRIRIENFRSLKKVEIDVCSFNIFVGKNNHGKTNLFEAIDWFYTAKSSSNDLYFDQKTDHPIEVEIFYDEVSQADIDKLSSETNQTKITNVLNGSSEFSIRKTSADHKRKYIVGGQDLGNPSGLDAAINEFIPKLEYISTKIRLDDVSKYKDKNPIGLMLSGVLTSIVESSPEYLGFREQFNKLFDSEESEVRVQLNSLSGQVETYLQKQFPDGTTIKFEVNPPHFGDLLKSFETEVNDGISTKAEDKGDGMQRAIMLSIIQTFADFRKRQSGGGSFLFLIDEAELHLHPSAQRSLKKALIDLAATDQVFVNTHSSVLVVDDHSIQDIYKVEKSKGITNVTKVDDFGRVDIVFDLLGGSPSDLFLPRNFLIVEGRPDYEFLMSMIKRFYSHEFKSIKILFSGGDIDRQEGTFLGIHNSFSPLATSNNPIYRDKVVILTDKPNSTNQGQYKQFKEGYPYLYSNNQVIELEVCSLEEYYPGEFKKEPGEIDNSQKVEYAKKVAELISKEQFENEMPKLFEAIMKTRDLAFSV